MRTFATYIEYLLMTRHYCYVPGRGAYMLAEEPASVTMAIGAKAGEATITAPRRTVRFSSLHYHDDGLLANLLMEAEGMTYDEACRYIERQAPLLSDQFLQDAALHTDIDNFGFDDLSLNTWAAIEQRKALEAAPVAAPAAIASAAASKSHDTIAIPKYWIRRAAAIALVIVCFFANFLGLNDRISHNQLASVLNVSMFQQSVLVHQTWDAEDEEVADEDLLLSQTEIEDTQNDILASAEEDFAALDLERNEMTAPAPEEPVATAPAVAKVLPKTPETALAQSPNGRLYYIIVASCSTRADAERALANLTKDGYSNIGILERDERFRLYIEYFPVKTDAESFLHDLRLVERFHNAWLLPVRGASLLSLNIKNTYNDNHVSMELSHLNQRTERDQG